MTATKHVRLETSGDSNN